MMENQKPHLECWVKNCDCKCQTCKDNMERNSKLTNAELLALSMSSAKEYQDNKKKKDG